MTDIQPGTQTVVQDSQHANTPAITTLHRSLALLRIPVLRCGSCAGSDEDESEVSHLLQRTYRYSGKERDVTGLIHYGWRYYQPETGRWLSADPGGLIDGANLFRFCLNNPVNMADKDGLMPFPCINRGGNSRFHSFIVWTMAGTAVDVKNILMVIVQERLSKSRLTA